MENIKPIYWGNKLWLTIYSFIAVYPNNPTQEQIKSIMTFFETLKHLLPCSSCRTSFTKFSSEDDTNIKNVLHFQNRNNLIKMIFAFRKKVENKVGFEYCSTVKYLTFKMNNMICVDNPNEYVANNLHEYAFIPVKLENKIYDYIKKYKYYINDYDSKNTQKIVKKLKHFLDNPDSNSKYYLLWIERNNKCRDLISKIEKNMCEKKYDTMKSFNSDKKYHIQLFYLGCTIIPSDELAYLLQ